MGAIRRISILCLLCAVLFHVAVESLFGSGNQKCPPPFDKQSCPFAKRTDIRSPVKETISDRDQPGFDSSQLEGIGRRSDNPGLTSHVSADSPLKKDYTKGENQDEKRRCPPPFDKPWCGSLNKKSSNIELPGKETPSDRDLRILDSSPRKISSQNNDDDAEDDFPLPSDVPPASPTNRKARRGEAYGVGDSFMWKRILARLLEKEATEINN